MPSKQDLRLNITFPDQDFRDTIKRDAEIARRSESSQIIWILEQYYQERKREADLFTPARQREAKRDVPVYETPTPDQIAAARASKIREMHGLEKS